MKVVITGAGVVSPAGIGLEAFWKALQGGSSGIGEIASFEARGLRAGAVTGFDFGELFDDRRFRRADDVTKFALVSSKEAVSVAGADAALLRGARAAAVVAVTHGAIGFSTEFHGGVVKEGPVGASPAVFSDSVMNAPTGNLTLYYGMNGPSYTLVGDSTVALQSVKLAAGLIRDGMADLCVVSATEELNERVYEAYSRAGRIPAGAAQGTIDPFGPAGRGFLPGEGAASIVLESERGAKRRGASPLARISGYGNSSGAVREDNIYKSVTKALKAAAIEAADIDAAIVSANGSRCALSEGASLGRLLREHTPVASIKPHVGEGYCAASLMSAVAAVLCVSRGRLIPNGHAGQASSRWAWADITATPKEAHIKNMLVCSTGLRNEAAALVLSSL